MRASDVTEAAQGALNDPQGRRWNTPFLLAALTEAQRQVVALKPEANSITVAVELVAGVRQTLPEDGYGLVRVMRNMGSDGNTPGRYIREVPLETLLSAVPAGPTGNAAPVDEYAFDDRDARAYYVNPPSAGAFVELIYGAEPAAVQNVDSVLPLSGGWQPALLNYVLFRALSRETNAQDQNRAAMYFDAFLGGVAGKAEGKNRFRPGQIPMRGEQ